MGRLTIERSEPPISQIFYEDDVNARRAIFRPRKDGILITGEDPGGVEDIRFTLRYRNLDRFIEALVAIRDAQ